MYISYEDYMMCQPMTDGKEITNFLNDLNDEEEENKNDRFSEKNSKILWYNGNRSIIGTV